MDLPANVWRKASFSESQSDCVEVAMTENLTAVRDSKNPTGGALVVNVAAFVSVVKAEDLGR